MRPSLTISTLLAACISNAAAQQANGTYTTGTLGNATAITDNPKGASFIATLPDEAFDKAAYPNGGNVKGSIQAVSMPDGTGVMFHVSFSNVPAEGGPFLYHIHDQPVPENGNCSGTLAHLDPFQRGESPPCDSNLPETCQVGDLAGKHGKVELTNPSDIFTATYTENFASTLDGIGAFFGNRSFVFHFGNTTRITCANFKAVDASSSACTTSATSSSSTSSSVATSTTSSSTGTASSTTTTTRRPTGTGRPNSTTTSPSPTFVTVAAGHTNAAKAMVAVGAAGLAFLL